jgi:hypothetical protein
MEYITVEKNKEPTMTAALVTPEIALAVQSFERYGYEPIEKALSGAHTTTFYLANFGVAVCDHHGLAEQLRQHSNRWEGAW